MSQSLLDDIDRVTGEVVYVIYADEVTGFGVVSLDDDDEQRTIKATGPLASLTGGQAVTLVGRWTTHPKHGRTFEADFYELATPTTEKGLTTFLTSDRFPGVGKTLAERLVKTFGTDLAEIVVTQPERLSGVTGVSSALAARIHGAWQAAGLLPKVVQVLAAVDLGPAVARAAVKRFGDEAADLLVTDPYAYLVLPGVRWKHADALGRAAGIDDDAPERLVAGAVGYLRGMCRRGGHTYVAREELRRRLPDALGGGLERADRAITLAVEDLRILQEDGPLGDLPTPLLQPVPLADAEMEIALRIADLEEGADEGPLASATVPKGSDLTDQQREALAATLTAGVSVLTGGPGTGKTFAISELVRIASKAGAQIALCAPTGRAAKRLEELTGHAATTVHRLLEARPEPGQGFVFGRGPDNPLPQDLIVADEWSMADVELAAALLSALRPPTRLLLVGDPDQLPPVGPGATLRDLLEAGTIPVTRLTQVHRQAAQSRIVTLAHDLNAGRRPLVQGRDGDVFAVPEHPTGIAARVASIVAERAPEFFGCSPADVQVLAPMYRGPAGVDALNAALKERLNPADGRKAVGGWHEGDRVVATRNDPEIDIANGDIGEVAATSSSDGAVTVAFPQGMVELTGDRVGNLSPAWCLTVHKSQGGEWPVVVMVLDRSQRSMLSRELTYTAITRARSGLLLVGDAALLAEASTRVDGGSAARRTTLAARLRRQAGRRRGDGGAVDPDAGDIVQPGRASADVEMEEEHR